MSKIYTRTGDGGQTSLVGGTRVSKTHPRLEAYGTIDELSSHLGLLSALLQQKRQRLSLPDTERSSSRLPDTERSGSRLPDTERFLLNIQHTLFVVSTLLATEEDSHYRPAPLDKGAIAALEAEIDALQSDVPPLRAFIIPGGCAAAAEAHVCRTVCRRAERRVLSLSEQVPVSADVVRYINRLSDYLFILARYLNIQSGTPEIEHR